MTAQIVIAIKMSAWQGATESEREAVLGLIGLSGGGETICPATWIDGNGDAWMVSAYWRDHVPGVTDAAIDRLRDAARAILSTDQLHATSCDDAAAYLAGIGLRAQGVTP